MHIEDETLRLDTVCQPLQVRDGSAPVSTLSLPLASSSLWRREKKSQCLEGEKSQRVLTREFFFDLTFPPLSLPLPLSHSLLTQYHPGASVTQVVGTTNFPPSFAAAGYASCFKGFG